MNQSLLIDLPDCYSNRIEWPWKEETSSKIYNDRNLWPKVSIVTPSYNQGQYIEETIRSVLLQNYPNLEYIIIDGGSTDNTIEVIKKYEKWITYWESEKDNGQAHAVNKGWSRSTGEILGWINSDDIYLPGSIHRAVEALLGNSNAGFVTGICEFVDRETDIVIGRIEGGPLDIKRLLKRSYIAQPAIIIRKSALDLAGYLDESLHYALDWEFWIRMSQVTDMIYSPNLQARAYISGDNKMSQPRWEVPVYSEFRSTLWKLYNNHLFPKELKKTVLEGIAGFYVAEAKKADRRSGRYFKALKNIGRAFILSPPEAWRRTGTFTILRFVLIPPRTFIIRLCPYFVIRWFRSFKTQ